jgi:hypothetical protein
MLEVGPLPAGLAKAHKDMYLDIAAADLAEGLSAAVIQRTN